jgi:hypothetical protein
MDTLRHTDPLLLLGAMVALFLTASGDPWWSVSGANSRSLLTVQVSPFYFHASASGLSSTVPFAEFLGPFTRVLLTLAFVALGMSSLSPNAWWRELAVYFSLATFIELYFSFLLIYHAAETTLLGAYNTIAPYSGTSHLPTVILGLDLNTYTQPLVTAGFTLPFYIGLLGISLVGGSMILKYRRDRGRETGQKGIEAIFTPEPD